MHRILPLALLLAACSDPPVAPSLSTGTFSGEGRDRLCIAGEAGNYRAGLVSYGEGDSNCSASGRLEVAEAGSFLVPRGEGACRIGLVIGEDEVRVTEVPPACGYYCGPGASLAGKSFRRAAEGTEAADFGGAPLC